MTPIIAQVNFVSETLARYFQEYIVPFGPRMLAALAMLLGLYLAGKAVQALVTRFGTFRGLDPDLTSFLASTASTGFLVVGGITAIGTIGVDVTALVTSLGLTGFALGFALKDIISNALSGLLILAYKPFQRNDRIRVAGFEGVVQKIDLRFTLLQAEGHQVFVPNSVLVNSSVVVLQPAKTTP